MDLRTAVPRLLIWSLILGILPFVAATGEALGSPESGRPVDTDPANFVEGPFTLEKERSQIECGVFSYGRDRIEHISSDNRTIFGLVLRTALTADLELQVFHSGHSSIREKNRTTGAIESADGLGDTTLQLKRNFVGNDQGRFAIGGSIFSMIGTGHDGIGAGRTASGGSLLVAVNLFECDRTRFTANSQIRYSQVDLMRSFEFRHSFVFGWEIDGKNSISAEINGCLSTADHTKLKAHSSVMFTHAFSESLTVDIAATVGLNHQADHIGAFLILSRWF